MKENLQIKNLFVGGVPSDRWAEFKEHVEWLIDELKVEPMDAPGRAAQTLRLSTGIHVYFPLA